MEQVIYQSASFFTLTCGEDIGFFDMKKHAIEFYLADDSIDISLNGKLIYK